MGCCSKCGRAGPVEQTLVSVESAFAPRVLLELRPPKEHKVELEELPGICNDVRAKLGTEHWCAAAMDLVVHLRSRKPDCKTGALSIAHGVRFIGWFVDRNLPRPPSSIVRTPISVAIECSEILSSGRLSCDGRAVVCRILSQFLRPLFDASGVTVANVAGT